MGELMGSEVASIILGAVLLVMGFILLGMYHKRWDEEEKNLPEGEEIDSLVLSQLNRRLQIALIIIFLGILIPVSENLITEKRPTLYVVCMTGVLMLALWILFLGILEIFLVRTRTKGNLEILNAQKKELERQIAEARKLQEYKKESSDQHDANLN